jgi:hypothetical protein
MDLRRGHGWRRCNTHLEVGDPLRWALKIDAHSRLK